MIGSMLLKCSDARALYVLLYVFTYLPAGTVRTMYVHCTYSWYNVRTMYVHCTYSPMTAVMGLEEDLRVSLDKVFQMLESRECFYF